MTDDLEARIARLEDIKAVETVKWRYLHACDHKDVATLRECLTPDAVLDYEGFPVFPDRDAFLDVFTRFGCVPHIVDVHHGVHPIVEIDGDRARGWFDLTFYQIDTQRRRHTQLAVSYEDEFVRDGGRWLIARSRSRRVLMRVSDVDESGVARFGFAGKTDIERTAA